MSFPLVRKRRLRQQPHLRNLVAETHLQPEQFVYPLFIVDRPGVRKEIPAMPGIYQFSIDNALIEIGRAMAVGIRAVMLFGIPDEKDPEATSAWSDHGIVQRAVRAIKKQFGHDLVVMTDTCLCEYMNHGHCGIVMEGRVLNDPSVELLARTAVSQAKAGADIVAPSDMMDGRVGAIRLALDEAGFPDTPIMAYSAKYASAFYGPFREAAESTPTFGDRKTYQMDARNSREALEETLLDLQEGADLVMVKPALPYLDILRQVRDAVTVPLAAYNVSGEYSMVKAAAQQGWVDERAVVLETLTAIRRAGADIIITYHAVDAATWLKG
ncbi:MAG: porphobilinogen synthase [Candidatus Melainabacteria bacterium]|nr:porphobilinogen synthase [Candidatus Melainabacteria bacterium]